MIYLIVPYPKTQKDKLFDELERDIQNLKSAVEKLKEENQNLKRVRTFG